MWILIGVVRLLLVNVLGEVDFPPVIEGATPLPIFDQLRNSSVPGITIGSDDSFRVKCRVSPFVFDQPENSSTGSRPSLI